MQEGAKEQIGNYELLDLIGDGAQGKVFKARRISSASGEKIDEIVAIKVLRFTGDENQIKQILHQAHILRQLQHPNIVRYIDFFTWRAGEWDEAHCLVMEYLEGESLQDRIARASGGLPWPEVKAVFEPALDALMYARGQSVIHRDIKPSNVFLTKDNQVKLIDFDIARREDSEQSTAGWKGTFDYMAPDFVTVPDFHGDEQSDLFSLGVCLYQALAGQLPLASLGEGAHIGYLNRWREAATPEFSYKAGAFRVLLHAKHVISKTISPQRDARYKTFGEMQEDLRKIRYRTLEDRNKDVYELTDIIGKGGFGEVFKGRRVSDGLCVAVKRLFAAQYSDRFIKEARIMKKYAHPALVRYIDFIEAPSTGGEKQYFLILEYLEGMPQWSLRNRLKTERSIPVDEAIPLFCQYLSALQSLHENPKPIIHRDIKPSNLYAPVGRPENGKLFDLGVARDVTGTATSGGIPGTLDYMAPEFAQEGHERGTPQSDIYSLALCLYEALTGKTVFEKLPPDVSTAWMKFKERSEVPPPLDFSDEGFLRYPPLKLILSKALAQQHADRYSSAAAMKSDLETLQSAPEDQAPARNSGDTVITASTIFSHPEALKAALRAAGNPPGPPPQKKKKRPLLKLLVAVIAFAVFLGIGLKYQSYLPFAQKTVVKKAQPSPMPQEKKLSPVVVVTPPPVQPTSAPPVEVVETKKTPVETVVEKQPAAFMEELQAALEAHRGEDAEKILADWKKVESDQGQTLQMIKALNTYKLNEQLAEIEAAIPPGLAVDKDFAQAEKAATSLSEVMGQTWEGLAEEDKAGRIMPVMNSLEQVLRARLQSMQKDGEQIYREGRDDGTLQRDLKRLQESAPTLLQLFESDFNAVAVQLLNFKKERTKFQALVQSLENGLPSQIKGDEDLAILETWMAQMAAAQKTSWTIIDDKEKNNRLGALQKTAQEMEATYKQMQTAKVVQKAQTSVTPVLPKPVAKPVPAVDPVEASALKALRGGAEKFRPNGSTTLNVEQFNALLAAAQSVEQEYRLTDRFVSEKEGLIFLAATDELWRQASSFGGSFGNDVRQMVWAIIHGRLLHYAENMVSGELLMRAPNQQTQIRLGFFRLLARVEGITGHIADSSSLDPLRATVIKCFDETFFHESLLENEGPEDVAAEAKIPWLKAEFAKARVRSKSAGL